MKYIILMGKSAVGKDTILKEIVRTKKANPLISHTTRPIRVGEKNGVEYKFCDNEVFESMIAKNQLVEYRKYNIIIDGNMKLYYYGIKKDSTRRRKDVVVILDVQGTKDFINYYGKDNCEVYLIKTKDKIRKQRCIERGDFNQYEWNRRKIADRKDFSRRKLKSLDFKVVKNNNGDVETIVSKILKGE